MINSSVVFSPVNRCPICDAVLDEVVIQETVDDLSFQVFNCSGCGVGVTSPQPSDETIGILYSRQNGEQLDLSSRDFDDIRKGSFFDKLKNVFVEKDVRSRIIGNSEPNCVVDYSCGNGRYANAVKKIEGCRVIAVDFHSERPQTLNDDVEYISHDQFDVSGVDVLILRHVLEHVKDPVELLKRLSRSLNPNGYIYVEVPNKNSIWSRIFGANWIQWYLPRHLYHFNPSSLTLVLRQAGMYGRIEKLEMPLAGSQLARSFQRQSYTTSWKLLGIILHPIQIALEKIFRTSGCIYIQARLLESK